MEKHCRPVIGFKTVEFGYGFVAGVLVTLLVGWFTGWLTF